jgi:hypothetical protein
MWLAAATPLVSVQAWPMTRFSRAVSTTSSESCSRPLIVTTRSICVSRRTRSRKFPRVDRITAATTSEAGNDVGKHMPTGAQRCSNRT